MITWKQILESILLSKLPLDEPAMIEIDCELYNFDVLEQDDTLVAYLQEDINGHQIDKQDDQTHGSWESDPFDGG